MSAETEREVTESRKFWPKAIIDRKTCLSAERGKFLQIERVSALSAESGRFLQTHLGRKLSAEI